MFEIATSEGLLSPLNNRAAKLRVTMYADDAAVFLKPIKEDVSLTAHILESFGHASGLVTNRGKCAAYPINCDGLQLEEILADFTCPILSFPCQYLGLPLHVRCLRRVDVQPLLDKMANRLPTWKGKFLNRAGRLKLVNSVLSSMPTYFLSVFAPNKWALKRMDRIRRGFFWKGTEEASGGHCLVRWNKVKRPKKFGGLSVLDLELFSRALRLRWLWFQWVDPDRPWAGSEVPCNEVDRQLFRLSTRVTVGDGHCANFWESAWIDGKAPRDLAPNLYKLAWRKNNTVEDDLKDMNWTRVLWHMSTVDQMSEFVLLWGLVQEVQLVPDQPDTISWHWTTNGQYSSKSAYATQFFWILLHLQQQSDLEGACRR
jgi:hypothetical protein